MSPLFVGGGTSAALVLLLSAGVAHGQAAPTPYRPTVHGITPYPHDAQVFPDRSDKHAMPRGALIFSGGFGSISTYRVAVGSSPLVREAEGEATAGGIASIHYHYPIIPLLSARGFVRMSGFETELSLGGGYQGHTHFTFGIAPALSVAAIPRRSQSLHVVLSLPVGFVLGSQPGNPPRDAVSEDVNLGTGYRIGGHMGLLAVVSRHVGVSMDLEVAREDVFHRVTYRALDGRSPARDLNLHYSIWSVDFTIGVAWVL
jgi:hypothetical protein